MSRFLPGYFGNIYQTRISALKAVYPCIHLVNRSIKQHGVSGVRLLCGAQDDVLILGNLLPRVSLGKELLTDPVSLGSASARLPWASPA